MKKINFDLKYRFDIENGSYSVQTRTGWPVTILNWNCIVEQKRKILVEINQHKLYYDPSGKWWNDNTDFFLDLVLIKN